MPNLRPISSPAEWGTETTQPDPSSDLLPQPTGWRIIVRPIVAAAKTAGGIHLPDEVQVAQQRSTRVGRVLAIGPLAFTRADMQNPDEMMAEDWYEVGDYVLFPANGPLRFEVAGVKLLLMNDDEPMAVVPDPSVMKIGHL